MSDEVRVQFRRCVLFYCFASVPCAGYVVIWLYGHHTGSALPDLPGVARWIVRPLLAASIAASLVACIALVAVDRETWIDRIVAAFVAMIMWSAYQCVTLCLFAVVILEESGFEGVH